MAAIGGITVIGFDGPVQLSGRNVEKHMRPGIGGYDLHDKGIHGDPFALVATLDLVSTAARTAAKKAFFALKGTPVTIVDNMGETWFNIQVDDVKVLHESIVSPASGGVNSGNYLIRVKFALTNLSTSF